MAKTDSWEVIDGIDKAALKRGIDFLSSKARLGSRYFHQLKLNKGEAIILANYKISHGRTSYHDTLNCRRCMYRVLYLKKLGRFFKFEGKEKYRS